MMLSKEGLGNNVCNKYFFKEDERTIKIYIFLEYEWITIYCCGFFKNLPWLKTIYIKIINL